MLGGRLGVLGQVCLCVFVCSKNELAGYNALYFGAEITTNAFIYLLD